MEHVKYYQDKHNRDISWFISSSTDWIQYKPEEEKAEVDKIRTEIKEFNSMNQKLLMRLDRRYIWCYGY